MGFIVVPCDAGDSGTSNVDNLYYTRDAADDIHVESLNWLTELSLGQ